MIFNLFYIYEPNGLVNKNKSNIFQPVRCFSFLLEVLKEKKLRKKNRKNWENPHLPLLP